jgi:sugar phosphate isomerase/epimerase
MLLGYNTNGLAHHDLFDAVELLADIGYRSVAITIDHTALPPASASYQQQMEKFYGIMSNQYPMYYRRAAERLQNLLINRQMRSVIETGARFLLDPRQKHEPTLVSPDPADRRRRIEFYKYAVDTAFALGSDCVSLWSGRLQANVSHIDAFTWLVEGLCETLDYASSKRVTIAFEPEPGMLIDTMARWEELLAQPGMEDLCLTLDVGHLHCQSEGPIETVIQRWATRLVNVHIEDMRAGRHEHLMFGDGEIDFPPVLRALENVGYVGGVHVELSRHSHEGPSAAQRAYDILSGVLNDL